MCFSCCLSMCACKFKSVFLFCGKIVPLRFSGGESWSGVPSFSCQPSVGTRGNCNITVSFVCCNVCPKRLEAGRIQISGFLSLCNGCINSPSRPLGFTTSLPSRPSPAPYRKSQLLSCFFHIEENYSAFSFQDQLPISCVCGRQLVVVAK